MVIVVKNSKAQAQDLFGQPDLLNGEDVGRYNVIKEQVIVACKPTDIFTQAATQDLMDQIFEGERFKRLSTQLIKATQLDALVKLLTPTESHPELARQTAASYYSGDPQKMKGAKEVLLKRGITDEMINAKAMALEAPALLTCDRLRANRTNARTTLLKDYFRSQRQEEKRKAKAAKAALQSKGE